MTTKTKAQDEGWGQPPVRETISSAAYRLIRETILRGRIPMGTWVNEGELAKAWEMSRTPIRDGLRRLEAEGLVQAVPGRGFYVPILSPQDVKEVYEIREALEGFAANRAAENATEEFIASLTRMLRAYEAAIRRDDPDGIISVDIDLHGSIARMSGNQRLERAIDMVRAQVQLFRVRTVRLEGRPQRTMEEMVPLIAAIGERNGKKAEACMRRHILSLREELLATFDQVLRSTPSRGARRTREEEDRR